MLWGFMQRADFRRWLSQPNDNLLIQHVKGLIDQFFGGTKHNDEAHLQQMTEADAEAIHRGKATHAPRELQTTSKTVYMRARFRVKDVIYARRSTHLGNSLIIFYVGGDRTNSAVPGSIEYIYEDNGVIRFATRRYLDWNGRDPFSRWPDFPAKIWSTKQYDRLETVELNWVMSHFAQYQFGMDFILGQELQVVLGLD